MDKAGPEWQEVILSQKNKTKTNMLKKHNVSCYSKGHSRHLETTLWRSCCPQKIHLLCSGCWPVQGHGGSHSQHLLRACAKPFGPDIFWRMTWCSQKRLQDHPPPPICISWPPSLTVTYPMGGPLLWLSGLFRSWWREWGQPAHFLIMWKAACLGDCLHSCHPHPHAPYDPFFLKCMHVLLM